MSHIVVYVPPNHLWPCPINHTAQGKFILSPEWLVGLKEVHLLVCLEFGYPRYIDEGWLLLMLKGKLMHCSKLICISSPNLCPKQPCYCRKKYQVEKRDLN